MPWIEEEDGGLLTFSPSWQWDLVEQFLVTDHSRVEQPEKTQDQQGPVLLVSRRARGRAESQAADGSCPPVWYYPLAEIYPAALKSRNYIFNDIIQHSKILILIQMKLQGPTDLWKFWSFKNLAVFSKTHILRGALYDNSIYSLLKGSKTPVHSLRDGLPLQHEAKITFLRLRHSPGTGLRSLSQLLGSQQPHWHCGVDFILWRVRGRPLIIT